MDSIAIMAIIVVLATISLPLLGVGLTLWMGGADPKDGGADTPPRA